MDHIFISIFIIIYYIFISIFNLLYFLFIIFYFYIYYNYSFDQSRNIFSNSCRPRNLKSAMTFQKAEFCRQRINLTLYKLLCRIPFLILLTFLSHWLLFILQSQEDLICDVKQHDQKMQKATNNNLHYVLINGHLFTKEFNGTSLVMHWRLRILTSCLSPRVSLELDSQIPC